MNRLASLAFALVIAVTAIGANADLEKLPAEVQSRVAAYLAEKKKTHGAGVDELQPTKIEEKKQQGLIRIQYEQYHNGVKVFGSYARITVNNGQPAGRVEVVNDLDVATTPSITLEAAIAIAARQLLISGTPSTHSPELLILPRGVGGATRDSDLLVWMFLISSDDEPQTVKAHRAWIDAVSGEIVGLLPNAPHGKPTYHGPLQWHPYWWPSGYNMNTPATFCNGGKCKTFAYHFDDFYATDPCFGLGYTVTPVQFPFTGWGQLYCAAGPNTKDGFVPAEGGNYVCDKDNLLERCKPLRHSLLDTHQSFVGDGTPGSQNHKTFVADAYVAMRMTFEYLWRIHGRQGLDGNNGPQIRIETRSPEINNNAQWQVDKNRVIVAPDNVDHYDYSSIDVIAHEIGHGLDSYGPRMTVAPPPPCPETNKIMEATADMFSMLASNVIEPTGFPYRIMEHPKKANWNGSTFTSTVAERYLDDPTINNKPACYNQFIACMPEHTGSTPASHMFFLLTYGGTSACNGSTVTGIGFTQARELWDQMFFQELPPNATYPTLKNAFLDAAFTLDGNQQGPRFSAVQSAFVAINMP